MACSLAGQFPAGTALQGNTVPSHLERCFPWPPKPQCDSCKMLHGHFSSSLWCWTSCINEQCLSLASDVLYHLPLSQSNIAFSSESYMDSREWRPLIFILEAPIFLWGRGSITCSWSREQYPYCTPLQYVSPAFSPQATTPNFHSVDHK